MLLSSQNYISLEKLTFLKLTDKCGISCTPRRKLNYIPTSL